MADDSVYSLGAMWATKIADAYAAEARPHLSAATKEKFRQRLEEEVVSLLIIRKPNADWPDTINDLLDEEEKSRLYCVGPRLLTVNESNSEVIVGPRPEPDR